MNGYQFIASIVGSLAWPAALVMALLILRRPLKELIPLLQRLKYKDLELEFGKRLEGIKAKVPPSPAQPRIPPSTERSALSKLADVSPRSAILEAWRMVEDAAREAASRLVAQTSSQAPGPTPRLVRLLDVIQYLERSERITPGAITALHDLRHLRNDAAHAPDSALTTDSALEYASLTEQIATYLNTVARSDAPR